MPTLPEFRLESYFSKWEFVARYHLTASDAQTVTKAELLAMAGDEDRARWEGMDLGYGETYGLPALREAIAGTYEHLEAEDVLCFAGAEEALNLAMHVLLDAGDHAIVVTPNYQAAETIPLSICEVTGIALDPSNDWHLDVDALERAIRPNTRVVSVNFPNNPTGTVPDQRNWARLVRLCDEHGIRLFSDEVYRGVETDQDTTLPQAADLSATALSLNVLSKAYGLGGLRIGWIACRDRALLRRLEGAKHYASICNSTVSEMLALIALHSRERLLDRNRRIIAANVPEFDAFFAAFPGLFEWRAPQGGCVTFPRYLGADGVEAMCADLVAEAGVLLLPASMYVSELTPVPTDRFRVGVGRSDPKEALEVWASWIERRQRV
ncbi:Aspartate/methionine/tyrosine aminotransferase [Amycolatopsis marina]|uniref:Aspartate/methionine/tyrosine aminotransferase n=1 Tax=Amycolatopsis marina TaxID=490629 RepID=A0A1I0ZJM2_9PSEU|nr:aminotransferase class I/II-fold pyridoxal phosphate-dependent enzyme [Amycolatopsis marina]SFB25721.1 Aspartate/methionine/tyrosine aminotransferase [Amycolatopsis marina]